jgi:hypothetical protein
LPNRIKRRLASLIFRGVVQEAANGLNLIPACGQHATGDTQKVSDVGYTASFPYLGSVKFGSYSLDRSINHPLSLVGIGSRFIGSGPCLIVARLRSLYAQCAGADHRFGGSLRSVGRSHRCHSAGTRIAAPAAFPPVPLHCARAAALAFDLLLSA